MTGKQLFANVFRYDGNVIVSKDVDSGEDMCPHNWVPIRKVEEYDVFKCQLNGCIRVHSPYRSSIDEFIKFLRTLPKIDKLPEHSLLDVTELARSAGLDQRQVKKYYGVLQGLDINGRPAHTMADSKPLYYLDDDISDEKGPTSPAPYNPNTEEPLRPLDKIQKKLDHSAEQIDTELGSSKFILCGSRHRDASEKGFFEKKPVRRFLKSRRTILLKKPILAMLDDADNIDERY